MGRDKAEVNNMSASLQIITRQQLQSNIERCLASCLPETDWVLTHQRGEKLWLLTLSAGPCSESAQRVLHALMMSDWLIGMDFSCQHQ
jgi:hypothetical protein